MHFKDGGLSMSVEMYRLSTYIITGFIPATFCTFAQTGTGFLKTYIVVILCSVSCEFS